MTRDDVQRWLDAYVEAWRTYDPAQIADLFADDVEYRYQPYHDPVVGRDAIVADWLESPDAAGSWTARYEPYVVEGDRAVAVGESRYLEPGRIAAHRVLQRLAAALRRRRTVPASSSSTGASHPRRSGATLDGPLASR